MLVLVMDTSSAVVAAALHDGTQVVAAASELGAQAHGELLAPVVARVLGQAGASPDQLTAVCAGVGPGPFTGLRVGVVTARVMGLALGIPVHGVCSLDVLAHQAVAGGPRTTGFVVATDARRKEVYVRRYDAEGRALGEPAVLRPADLDAEGGDVVGPGAALYPDVLPRADGPVALDPSAMADLVASRLRDGGADALLPAEPLYLRRPDAVANASRKRVTP